MNTIITIWNSACAAGGIGAVGFDNIDLAIAFAKALAGTISPESFAELAGKVMPEAAEMTKNVVKACFGDPA